jgi:hypothetical protein
MRRGLVVGAITCACLAAEIPAASATSAPPRVSLEAFACQRAANALDRAVSVTAVMRPLQGTQRMEMKFWLLRRVPGDSSFSPVAGRGLGQWLHPDDATLGQRPDDVWRLSKPVVNLAAPAVYRFKVMFRWIGASGRALDRVSRLSAACYQTQ